MKSTFLYFLFLSSIVVSAQKDDLQLDKIAHSEMKMASKKLNLLVNPNTQNYDITYHELRFSVDPANYYISGVVTELTFN